MSRCWLITRAPPGLTYLFAVQLVGEWQRLYRLLSQGSTSRNPLGRQPEREQGSRRRRLPTSRASQVVQSLVRDGGREESRLDRRGERDGQCSVSRLRYVPTSSTPPAAAYFQAKIFWCAGKFIAVWREKESALAASQLTNLLLQNASHEGASRVFSSVTGQR